MPPMGTDCPVSNEDYENKVINLTSCLDFTILDSPKEDLEHLQANFRGMLQRSADKSLQR